MKLVIKESLKDKMKRVEKTFNLRESKQVRYIIKDRAGNQRSAPSYDDSELWDRVSALEERGIRGLSVVVYDVTETNKFDFGVYDHNKNKFIYVGTKKDCNDWINNNIDASKRDEYLVYRTDNFNEALHDWSREDEEAERATIDLQAYFDVRRDLINREDIEREVRKVSKEKDCADGSFSYGDNFIVEFDLNNIWVDDASKSKKYPTHLDHWEFKLEESIEENLEDVVITDDSLKIDTPTKEQINFGYSNMIGDLIKSEYGAIQEYTDAISTIKSENADENMITVLQDILNEENIHVGQLQKLLQEISKSAKNINKGEQEAEEQLSKTEDNLNYEQPATVA